MSATEWEGGGASDAEEVDPGEVDAAPPGTADEEGMGSESGGGGRLGGESEGTEGGGWTEGGGTLGPESEGTEGGGWTDTGSEAGAMGGAGSEDIAGGDTGGASELRERMGEEERF